jgi:hypothetical protein
MTRLGGAWLQMSFTRQSTCDLCTQVDLWTNFRDYGLRSPVGLLRADAHTMPFRWGCCSAANNF